MPSKLLTIFAVVIAFTLTSCGLIPTQATSAIEAVNVDQNRLAIKGYDPVAYFTQADAVQGNQQFTAEYNGAVYYFASAENQALFNGTPAKYAPQYGGYCAFGVTQEKKYDIDPTAWAVVDGKLYLNLNAGAQRVWDKDRAGNIESGDSIWLNIEDKSVSEL
ncbi:YHS domain-containing protein [Glaciecola sp. XM2]|jgi:YHS domain-containing protein|uniref:YHS domain-containing (seleno)protein n=1 Tax=Glaciecola sp. XM2 TaxID=1914931 RepID=UPI001BDE3388|nr:YHS domain-containing (seleno)protein [Glaciecola sp. XM2]MBT1450608.1 YHS domain-containing protein [Glaciecola sp. XM2]